MSLMQIHNHKRYEIRLVSIWFQLAALLTGVLAPFLVFIGSASAAQLTTRSVTIGTSKASATTTFTYGFTTPATTNIGSIQFQACTTPLGTCTSPGGTVNMNVGATTLGTGWTGGGAFTRDGTGANNCTSAANVLCTARASAQSETAGARTISASSQVNPTAVASYYIRMTTYSDTTWTTAVDTGTVAYAITSQLTVNARVQEVLNFCVGTTSVDDGT